MQIVLSGSGITASGGLSVQSSLSNAQSKQAKEAVNAINESEILGYDREMKYSRDSKSNLGVVEVISRSTGEKIAQIPSELAVTLAEVLQTRK